MGHSLSLCYSFWCRWALMKWELGSRELHTGEWQEVTVSKVKKHDTLQGETCNLLSKGHHTSFWLLTQLLRRIICWNVHLSITLHGQWQNGFADTRSLHEVIPALTSLLFWIPQHLPMISSARFFGSRSMQTDLMLRRLDWSGLGASGRSFPPAMGLTWRKPDQRLSLNLLQRLAANMGVCTRTNTKPSHQHVPHWS